MLATNVHDYDAAVYPLPLLQVVNKTLYSASSDATARAWLKDLGEPLQVYKGHTRSVARLCVHQSVG
jgi:hypothetical protein